MNWLRKFMYGRYGIDQLSMTFIVVAFIFAILAPVLKLPSMIFTIIFILAYSRAFSKNINKRYMENQKFLKIVKPITSRFNKAKIRMKGRKDYKYFKCKNCKQTIKIPKGKGKIKVTCPKCKEQFIKKS